MIPSIGNILAGLPVKKNVKEYGLWKVWDKLVGIHISRNCQPDRLKDGILFLKVSSPVWSQQLQFMKAMIIEKVNGHMGDGVVKDLRFKVGSVGPVRKTNWKPWKEVSLDNSIIAGINNGLSSVEDPELREILRKLRIKEFQVKAWRDQRHRGGSSTNSPS